MNITLCAHVEGRLWSGEACMQVPELYRECFEPLKTGDAPIFSALAGEVPPHSQVAVIVRKTRDDAADILARELAAMIVCEMKKNDTHNGYEKETV